MTIPNAHVPEPELALSDATPVAQAFDDVYFSRQGGIAETEHVFLAGNGLPGRWQAPLQSKNFTIGELGFGTGLNFLVAWKRFRETASAGATLHYISIEKYPFKVADLRRILALQPELVDEAAALLAAYPLRLPGIHRIHLPQALLTLCFGDVAEMLEEVSSHQLPVAREGMIDAWFLDGFSPAKNPDMWSDAVLANIGKLSAPRATFATFTAAGAVRRGLQAAGFVVEKVPGFGHKREMLKGVFSRQSPVVSRKKVDGSTNAPSLLKPSGLILGAGIAGATLARALAERGMSVTVLERGVAGGGASGNTAAVLFPQLSKQWNRSTAWYFTAYGFVLRQLTRWDDLDFAHASPGMLRLPRHAEEEAQLQQLQQTLGLDASIVHWQSRDAASEQAGVALASGGAYFPQGSWICPPQLCRALLQHANITLREHAAAKKLMHDADGWVVTLENGEAIRTEICCVTAAQESALLLVDYGIRLNAVGGQVSEIAADHAAEKLRSILCHKGYIIPQENSYLIGATYHREGDMLAVRDAHHAENLAALTTVLPGCSTGPIIGGRSSLRATTPDRLPYIGALEDGLYVSTGHGSRGMLSAPLAAEILASDIAGEQSPITAALRAAVHPGRFRKA